MVSSATWIQMCDRSISEVNYGQDRTGQDRTGQDRTGQDRTGQDRTGQDRTGQDRTGQDRPDGTRLGMTKGTSIRTQLEHTCIMKLEGF